MNWEQVEGNWDQMKGKIKARWGKFTDDELLQAKGSKDQFVGMIKEKYGKKKEEAEKEVDEFCKSCKC